MNLTRHLYERQVFDMSNSYTHLSLQDRIIIAAGISNGSSKTAIADTIGKDNSTVGKEIRLHRFLKYKCRLPRECAAYKKCPYDRNCTPDCPDFVPFRCRRRDRTPAHAMAAAGIPDAVSINTGIIPRMPRRITAQLLLTQEPVST